MGCDIHAYLNYLPYENSSYYEGIKFRICRDYGLFALLASVRGNGNLKPKGLPKNDLADVIKRDLMFDVVETEDDVFKQLEYDPRSSVTTREIAEIYDSQNKKYSKYQYRGYVDETKKQVYHPDWHSHSWLSVQELDEVFNRYAELKQPDIKYIKQNDIVPEGYTPVPDWKVDDFILVEKLVPLNMPVGMKMIYANMKILELEKMNPQFVFWFDN